MFTPAVNPQTVVPPASEPGWRPISMRRRHWLRDREYETQRALEYALTRARKWWALNWLPGSDEEDVCQIAALAVLEARNDYDPDHPSRATFQSWAYRKVSDALLEACRRHSHLKRGHYQRVKRWERGIEAGCTPAELEAQGLKEPTEAERVPLSWEALAVRALASGQRVREIPDPGAGPDELAVREVHAERIRAAVQRISRPRWRETVELYHWHGLTFKAIARRWGVSESRAYQYYVAGLDQLFCYLEGGDALDL